MTTKTISLGCTALADKTTNNTKGTTGTNNDNNASSKDQQA